MALTQPVEDPAYTVTYGGTAIGAEISDLVTSLVYTDVEHGESDTLELTCEDRDHRWKRAWFPELAAQLTATLGYADGRLLNCGAFELDEIAWDGAPDTVRIKALATVITPTLRTNQSVGYDDTSLVEIVETVAQRNGLTARHDIDPAISLDRVTQNHERDLPFLCRLAEDYNYAFAVRGSFLDFWSIPGLEARGPVLTLDRRDLKSFSLALKSQDTDKEGTVDYQDPDKKQAVRGKDARQAAPGDSHRLLKRARSPELAERQAKAHLHRKDKRQLAGSLTIVGEVRLVAGINLQLTGLYQLDGKYHVERSTHRLARGGGYESEAQLYRVDPA